MLHFWCHDPSILYFNAEQWSGQRGACRLPDVHLESPLALNPRVSIPDNTHLPEKFPKCGILAKGREFWEVFT